MYECTSRLFLGLVVLAVSACETAPQHIVIHESPATSVWITVDSRAGRGHSHPFLIAPNTLATVLRGVHIHDRDTITGLGFLDSDVNRPAFTQAEIAVLVPHLTEALKKASPSDMATFYMVVGNGNQRRGVTSGGLFVDHDTQLHFTLANCRSIPKGGQDYTVAMEVDTRDEPLLPVTPHRFRVLFVPADAWIQSGRSESQPRFPAYESAYEDRAKTLVIDLKRLTDPQS